VDTPPHPSCAAQASGPYPMANRLVRDNGSGLWPSAAWCCPWYCPSWWWPGHWASSTLPSRRPRSPHSSPPPSHSASRSTGQPYSEEDPLPLAYMHVQVQEREAQRWPERESFCRLSVYVYMCMYLYMCRVRGHLSLARALQAGHYD
jgi:hypothetical protein